MKIYPEVTKEAREKYYGKKSAEELEYEESLSGLYELSESIEAMWFNQITNDENPKEVEKNRKEYDDDELTM